MIKNLLANTAVIGALLGSSLLADSQNEFGELIFEDKFERSESQEEKDELGNGWTTSSDKTAMGHKQVDLREGTMYMYCHKDANHAASFRHEFEFRDGTIGMRFMLHKKGDQLQLNFADMKLKTVHAGHLFDAIINLKEVRFVDKKTGAMDLKIREARKNNTISKRDLSKLLAKKSKRIPHRIDQQKWHELLVHVAGNQLTVEIDGKTIGSFESEGFGHPTKRLLRLLVPGEATVDDLRIWRKN